MKSKKEMIFEKLALISKAKKIKNGTVEELKKSLNSLVDTYKSKLNLGNDQVTVVILEEIVANYLLADATEEIVNDVLKGKYDNVLEGEVKWDKD